MANYRRERINDEVQKELSLILRDVKDPRVSSSMICITGVEVTPDLKYAKAYYSVLGVTPEVAIQKMKTNLPVRFTNPDGPCTLEGIMIEIDEATGKTTHIERFRK